MTNNWVEEFYASNKDLYMDNFKGTKFLIMVCPFSGNCNYWLDNNDQHFELSESGKRLYLVDHNRIVKQFNMKSIATFGYTR